MNLRLSDSENSDWVDLRQILRFRTLKNAFVTKRLLEYIKV